MARGALLWLLGVPIPIHSALPVLALAVPRTQIEPHTGDKRYVRRKKGKFTKSQDDAGRGHLLLIAARFGSVRLRHLIAVN